MGVLQSPPSAARGIGMSPPITHYIVQKLALALTFEGSLTSDNEVQQLSPKLT